MVNIQKVSLKLKTPNFEGNQLDFRKKEHDVIESVQEYNQFYSEKKLKIIEIKEKEIVLLITSDEKIDGRSLTYLSRRLYHDRNWSQYTRTPTKLFHPAITDTDLTDVPDYEPTMQHEEMTDQEMFEGLQALVLSQNIGQDKERKKDAIKSIKEILDRVL